MSRTKVPIDHMLGKVVTRFSAGDDVLKFVCAEGRYEMFHNQQCCERVYIESIVGDLDDLVGEPILLAEESTNQELTPDKEKHRWYPSESYTWTFYKLATRKGYVDIRWLGTSNGYYSERVDIYFFPGGE